MILTINGNDFDNYDSAYFAIKKALTNGLADENLAISELLKKHITSKHTDVTIHWINSEKSRTDMSYKDTVRYYKRKLQSEPTNSLLSLIKKIKDAENNKGDTIFEQILHSFSEQGVTVELL